MSRNCRNARRLRTSRALAAVGLAASLAGCATYHSAPLPTGPDAAAGLEALRSDPARFRVAPLKAVRVDARDGLDPLEVAVLAVLNSPDLAAKRAGQGVEAAQVFAAGLLPDPQITAGADKPISGPDTQTAFSVSPSLDLAGLLQRAEARHAARFGARQADLDLLWAEWGTAQQARLLAETILADEARAATLKSLLQAAAERADRSSAALARRDVTAQAATADLALKVDAESQLATAAHEARKARRDLNALLNLDGGVMLPVVPGADPVPYDSASVAKAMRSLPERRPDLLALKAGYAAQDANLRKAILAQFPLTQLAFALARDPAGVTTVGGAAAFALPIFDGGRGEVHVQSATRDQLRAEYQARLDQAAAEAEAAQAELSEALRMRTALSAEVPRLYALAAPARGAFERRDLDSRAYLTLLQTLMAKRADLTDRELAARVAEIQLETALFLPPSASRISP